MSDEPGVMLVLRCDEAPPTHAVTKLPCSQCKAPCWIAAPSLEMLNRKPEMMLICRPCLASVTADGATFAYSRPNREPVPDDIAKLVDADIDSLRKGMN